MRRTRIVAYLAAAVAALGLLRSVLGPTWAESGRLGKIRLVVIAAGLVVVLGVAGVVLYLMFSGPHMRVEPKILPYQAQLPAMPPGIVPVQPVWAQKLPAERNPLADTRRTRQAGQAYYRLYCLFCHGPDGHGDGPVGRSYVPTPTDLTTPAVQGLSDATLYRAMFTGVGHAPVLSYVIDPNTPWYIVAYVRFLPALDH
jgi:mono/diheme cytochrome c family protein